jgi:hypothetical protein
MATQRYISTSFWDDAWIQSIDPSEKLMYLYLMTNPLTNIAGIYKITDKRMHDDTGFNIDMVNRILQRFEKAKKAYRTGEYIIIPSWPRHQKWREKQTIESGIRKIISELPKSIRDMAIKVGYQYPINSVPVSYTYEPSYLDSDSDIDSDSNTDTEEKPDKPVKTPRVKKEFIPPKLEEVETYILEKKLCVIPSKFIDWYTKSEWKDKEGKQIQNWKNKLLSWDSSELDKNPKATPYSKPMQHVKAPERLCPHCHIPLRGSACPQCYANFDMNGKEI